MMYSADKHYSHLDPSVPIPEIEPRYDEHQLRMTRELVRRMPYVLGTLVLLMVVFFIWEPAFWARIGIVGVTYVSGLAYLIRYGRKNSTKQSRRDARNKLDTWGIPMSLMIRQQVYWIGIFILFMHLLDANFGSMQAVLMLGFYAFGAGLVLSIANRNFRQPGQISCERCFYPLVGLTLPTSCPECGRAILNLSFATDRPKLRDNRYLVAGILLTVFGAITIYVQFVKPSWLYAPIPRSLLIPLAARDRDAFDRLMSGSLTAADEQQLIEAMVKTEPGLSTALRSHRISGSQPRSAWEHSRPSSSMRSVSSSPSARSSRPSVLASEKRFGCNSWSKTMNQLRAAIRRCSTSRAFASTMTPRPMPNRAAPCTATSSIHPRTTCSVERGASPFTSGPPSSPAPSPYTPGLYS